MSAPPQCEAIEPRDRVTALERHLTPARNKSRRLACLSAPKRTGQVPKHPARPDHSPGSYEEPGPWLQPYITPLPATPKRAKHGSN